MDAQTFNNAMESLLNITVAGFGGAIAGLSISRSRASTMASMGSAARAISKMRSPPSFKGRNTHDSVAYVDQDLPITFAMACLTFATVVEVTKICSPTGFAMQYIEFSSFERNSESINANIEVTSNPVTVIEQQTGDEVPPPQLLTKKVTDTWVESSIRYLGDYTIGGAMAGILFKGAAIRTRTEVARQKAKNILSKTTIAGVPRTSMISGLLPGAALGLCAGLLQCGILYLQMLLTEQAPSIKGAESIQLEENKSEIPKKDAEDNA